MTKLKIKTTYLCRGCQTAFIESSDTFLSLQQLQNYCPNDRIAHVCQPDEANSFGIADPIKFEILKSEEVKQ